MKKAADQPVPVLVRVPPKLLRKLDASARQQQRSRTAEVCLRLSESLGKKTAVSA